MKKIILFFVLSTVGIKSFSQQPALVPIGKEKLTPGPVAVNTNTVSGENIAPASSATLRDYEQNPTQRQADELLAIALGYVAEKNLAQATALYKKVLAVQPNNIRAIRGLGNCYMISEENDAAISQFKKGWALGDNLSLLELANIYCFASRRYQDIKPLIPGLLKIQERTADVGVKHEIANILIAYSLFGTQEGDKQLFLSAIKGLNDDFILEREDTAKIIIHGLETFGEQDRADRLQAEMTRRKESETYFREGLRKYLSKDYDGAIVDFGKAIKLDPKNATNYYGRAGAEFQIKKFEMAVTDDTKAIELDPKFWLAYFNRGTARLNLGNASGAISDLAKAVELNPEDSFSYQNLGLAQSYLFQWRPALESFRKALQIDPALDWSQYYTWLIRSRLGEQEDATKGLAAYLHSSESANADDWSVKIGRFLIGSVTKEELLRSAEDDLAAKTVRLCQAYYYIGMKVLLAGDQSTAAAYFQKSVDTGAKQVVEYFNAEAELRALKTKSPR